MALLGVMLGLVLVPAPAPSPVHAEADQSDPRSGYSGYLHTAGADIVDSSGRVVRLTGVNWFGMETGTFAPHGLWARNWEDMLDHIAELGFNTIRLPFSNQLFDPKSQRTEGVDYKLNPDLKGLSGLAVMDKIVEGAGKRGLKVILDRHRPGIEAQSNLWYTDRYPEKRWIDDWKMLASRYRGNDTVIGADLHNEPHGEATWGTGDLKTDWRLAAERAGNAVLSVNPDLLIIVEGVERVGNDSFWWGGNLKGALEYPVRLSVPNRLVYSAHDYGPGVYRQSWFDAPDFPANMSGIWRDHWGYLVEKDIAPVLIGEFGGRSVGKDLEGTWQRALSSYIKQHGLSYTYWSLNPNSGDTGGVLLDDWKTVDKAKHQMLAQDQFPLLKLEAAAESQPTATAAPNPTGTPEPGQAVAQETSTANTAPRNEDAGSWPTRLWSGASSTLSSLLEALLSRVR